LNELGKGLGFHKISFCQPFCL